MYYYLCGHSTSGRVNSTRFFWEPPGSIKMTLPVSTFDWKAVEFGTEIAVAKILMEGGEELEGRGVVPDEYCIPTPNDLGAERDPCLVRSRLDYGTPSKKLVLPAVDPVRSGLPPRTWR
jgi:hypothetical protein